MPDKYGWISIKDEKPEIFQRCDLWISAGNGLGLIVMGAEWDGQNFEYPISGKKVKRETITHFRPANPPESETI